MDGQGGPSRRLTIAIALVGAGLGAWLGLGEIRGDASILDRLENLTLDARFLVAGPRPAPRDIVIAAIDDETLADKESHTRTRTLLAEIVTALAVIGPRAVVLDFAFPEPKDGDAELALAMRSTVVAIAAIGAFGGEEGSSGRALSADLALAPRPSRVLWPIDLLRNAAAQVGLANISTDAAGVPRYVPMIFELEDGVVPALALAAGIAATGAEPVVGDDAIGLGGRTIATDLGDHMPLRYYGPAGSFAHFSAARLLRGEVDPALVRGKIVVVGMTAAGLADNFATPFDPVAPGVEVVATAIGNLMGEEGLVRTRATRRIDAAASVLLPAVVVLLMGARRAALGFAAAGAVVVLWALGAFLAFLGGVWFDMATPLALALPLGAAYATARVIAERSAGARLSADRATLASFHSPALLDHLLQPGFLAEPVRQVAAVLFLDLTGSTGVAETLGPERSRDLLHAMQTLVERTVAAHSGAVINYMGDGVFAVFGLPAPQADDAAHALAAAESLREALAAWLASLPDEAATGLDFRIGVHFGVVILSRLGSPTHQQVTVAGDTVNVANRLLEVAKAERRRVVVSEDLWMAAGGGGFPETPLAMTVPIRGRTAVLAVRAWG